MIFDDPSKQKAFEALLSHKTNIADSVQHIERLLKDNFPEYYDNAYQHWIPQILTAIDNHNIWLSRGNYNMRDTINSILDHYNNAKTT